MNFRLEALNSLSAIEPNLVAAAREKVLGRTQKELRLESTDGIFADDIPQRVVLRDTDLFRPEAVILSEIRPPLLVRDGTFVMPANPLPEVKALLDGFQASASKMAAIHAAIALTGRIAFVNVPGRSNHGTGWIIRREAADSAIIATNRHVAQAFAYADGRGGYAFRTLPNFADMVMEFDFRQEKDNPERQDVPVVEVLFIAGSGGPDIALLRVKGPAVANLAHPEGWQPTVGRARAELPVGVVGYPGYSPDADPGDLAVYFGGTFDVKRIAFGLVRTVAAGETEFTHDATTLGGNSGSLVFDTDTGALVGIHYGGIAGTANYAVRASEVEDALRVLDPRVVAVTQPLSGPVEAEAVGGGTPLRGRDGYRRDFLGTPVEPPGLPGTPALWQPAVPDPAVPGGELVYRHFSIWMARERLVPLLAAVNIDGTVARRVGRSNRWFIDPRLPREVQIDARGYKSMVSRLNHFVRWEDPIWGGTEAAEEAGHDGYCMTNAVPPHEALEQADWQKVEDYVLAAVQVRGQRLSVFSGPVLRKSDRLFRGVAQVPTAFWKIVAVQSDTTGALATGGFLVCQGELVKEIKQEQAHGDYLTYQVPVTLIGALTGLDVAHLAALDSLPASRQEFCLVRGPEDLKFGAQGERR